MDGQATNLAQRTTSLASKQRSADRNAIVRRGILFPKTIGTFYRKSALVLALLGHV
jgi:hypothetical protein